MPPRVAFAIGRPIGNAVTRNRLRRRLRALVAAEAAVGLPAGWYLLGASPAAGTADPVELREAVHGVLAQVRA